MKEFKEIIDGVAHSLNMSVDALVKAYPQLSTVGIMLVIHFRLFLEYFFF